MVVSSPLLLTVILLLSAQSVFNLLSNKADKALMEQCSRRTKQGKRNSFLWTLENYPSVYIFGSIHRPHSLVWPQIPRNVKRAFRSSKKVYFEIDLTSFQYLSAITKCQYLPNEQTLTDVLPPDVLEKLRKYLDFIHSRIPEWLNANQIKERTNPDKVFQDMTRNWQQKRPVWILLQLASFNKDYVQSKGIPSLDFFLFLKGKKSRKSIGHLESPEEHCGINNVNSSQAMIYLDELLTKYSFARKKKLNQSSGSNITYHYFCGNLSKYIFSHKDHFQTTSSRMEILREFEDSLTKELFERRNKQMVKKIIKEIKFERKGKNRRMFFTVGAGHLVGSGSILELLKSKGFKPKHISSTDALPRSRRYKMNDQKKIRYETKTLRSKKLMKKLQSKILKKKLRRKKFSKKFSKKFRSPKLTKKSRYKTKTRKGKAQLKSFSTITSTNPQIAITEESIILDVDHNHRSSSVKSGIRLTSKIFATLLVSWIVHILM